MSSYRIQKMASTVRGILSDAIRTELNDPRISAMTSVTRVELSGDLQIAKVFVSMYGEEAERRRSFAGLVHARGYLQRCLASRLTVRQCPELRLELDDSIRKSAEMMALIDDAMRECRARDGEVPAQNSTDDDGTEE